MTSLQLAAAIDSSYGPLITIYGLSLAIKVVRRIFSSL